MARDGRVCVQHGGGVYVYAGESEEGARCVGKCAWECFDGVRGERLTALVFQNRVGGGVN